MAVRSFPHVAKRLIPERRDQLWVADLTYVAIKAGFVYLAIVLDAWSRKVVGFAISRTMDVRIVLAALTVAIRDRTPPPGCIHHSDRGAQGGFQLVVATPGRRNVAMAGRRRSDRALRDKLRSPGRPGVARREDRRRFWALIATGLSSEDCGDRRGGVAAGRDPLVSGGWWHAALRRLRHRRSRCRGAI